MKNSLDKTSTIDIKTLLAISAPLMLSSLSSSLMFLCDRLFLAHYSLGAFNSIVTISSVILMLQIGVNICASTADVFVGQLNGAEKKLNISLPTWQMIWFSLLTSFLFIPIACSSFLYPNHIELHQDEIFYFKLLITLSPLSPLQVALSSFFIGRKKIAIPLMGTLLGNAINLILNYLLIFGQQRFHIPELGIKRAAIATAIGQFATLIVLLSSFLSKSNRSLYHTHHWHFDMKLMIKILKIGYPNAIAQITIAGAWSCFFILMNRLGEASITLASFMQTLTGFFVFLIQGLSRGAISISANLIGERKATLISKVLFSGIQLTILFSSIILIGFLIHPNGILKLFFGAQDFDKTVVYFDSLKWALLWGWLAFVFKSIRSLLSGILTASGNTLFIMWNEVISIWVCFIMPIWLSMQFATLTVSWAYFIGFLYNLIAVVVYHLKLKKIDWEKEGQLI